MTRLVEKDVGFIQNIIKELQVLEYLILWVIYSALFTFFYDYCEIELWQ